MTTWTNTPKNGAKLHTQTTKHINKTKHAPNGPPRHGRGVLAPGRRLVREQEELGPRPLPCAVLLLVAVVVVGVGVVGVVGEGEGEGLCIVCFC
jgi:hypothetical protein